MSEFEFYCELEEEQGLGCQFQCTKCSIKEIKNIKPTVLPHYPDLDFCKCKDCLSGETALQRQLDHKFYKDADAFRNGVKMETLKKAAQKYPEPFDPSKWTIEELAKHAMAENYDQQNYIYGMFVRLLAQQKEIEEQAAKIIRLESYQNHSQRKFSELGKVLRSCYPEKSKPGKHVVDTAIDLLNHKGQYIDERI